VLIEGDLTIDEVHEQIVEAVPNGWRCWQSAHPHNHTRQSSRGI